MKENTKMKKGEKKNKPLQIATDWKMNHKNIKYGATIFLIIIV